MTRALRDKYNSIHNLGVSLDPPTILTGTIGVPDEPNISGITIISGRGTVRIGTAEAKTGILKSYVDFNLQDNMTIQNLIDQINDANPDLGITAALTDDGRFQLQSTNTENGVIIGSVGEQIASISASSSHNPSIGTNPSHFFGLNNLFETGKQNLGGSSNDVSSHIYVRKDIVESGGKRIACGTLARTGAIGKKVLNTGDTSTISLLANAYNDPKTSFQTGKSSTIQTNLKMFAIDIINSQKRDAEQTANKLRK